MNPNHIADLFDGISKRPEVRAAIPMSYTPGIPFLSVSNEELCINVPFLRYKVTGEKDKTLVYPIRYVVTYVIPENIMIRFVDLAYTPLASKIDFNKPVGHFRHRAIADLNRDQYNALRRDTLDALNHVAAEMLGEEDEDPETDTRLYELMSRIVEPSLYPIYHKLAPSFFKKYINHGKDKK